MVPSIKYEVHFFDWTLFPANISSSDLASLRQGYIEKFNNSVSDLHLHHFEKTPDYMFEPFVPEKIRIVCPWAKIIILLRDPLERAYSHFKMSYSGIDKQFRNEVTFEEYIKNDIELLNQTGILDKNFLDLDEETRQSKWEQYWKSMKRKRNLRFSYAGYIGRSLYFVQLERWFKHYKGEMRKNIFISKSENLLPHPMSKKINMKPITDFIGIHEHNITNANKKIHASRRNMGPMKKETRQYLEKIFDPFNKRLVSLLGDGWEDPWPYSQ